MKLLILIITITWSFSGGYQETPRVQIVDSVEHAAWVVYKKHESQKGQAQPDHWKSELYEIDIKTNVIKKIKLPKVVIGFKYD